MTLNVLIADDEAPARRKIARMLEDRGDVRIVAEASNGIDAIDLITMTKPDLAFLDIQMPDLDGLGVAQAVAEQPDPPAIVFVTAFDRYAIKAFEVQALDYLLKPFDRERFDRVLERARETRVLQQEHAPALAQALQQARREEPYLRRLLIPNDGRSFFVNVEEIARLEADGNNVRVHCKRGVFTLRSTLEALEARLNPDQFARVHRSHLLNIDAIAEIRPWFHGDYRTVLHDGSEIAWSRRYAAKRPDLIR